MLLWLRRRTKEAHTWSLKSAHRYLEVRNNENEGEVRLGMTERKCKARIGGKERRKDEAHGGSDNAPL